MSITKEEWGTAKSTASLRSIYAYFTIHHTHIALAIMHSIKCKISYAFYAFVGKKPIAVFAIWRAVMISSADA
jgi:hypothetical protein